MEGILPLWKERGMTSHDCVMQLRRILKIKKIGHTGTLDPDVDGVLPICIGKATKVIEYIMDSGKEYKGEITLGFSTTTEDKSGELVEKKTVAENITEIEIDDAMKQLVGEIVQVPPMYSAVKVNGRRLYDYARKGEEVERPQRKAVIESFERTSEPLYDAETQTVKWSFKVKCGKGTYVRTLAVDTGKMLGYPAHMSDLTRTASGGFHEMECFTLEDVARFVNEEVIEDKLLPIEQALSSFPRFDVSEELWKQVKNGAVLETSELDYKGPYPVVFYRNGKAAGIYDKHPSKDGRIKPRKMLRNDL